MAFAPEQGAPGNERREDSWSTGQKVAAVGLGILGGALAGFALAKIFDDKDENIAARTDDSRRNNDDAYTRNKCIMCDDNIIDSAKRLSCNHVIHHDCLRSLIVNGSTLCPKCQRKLNYEDLYCINKSVVNNRANQLNPNHRQSGPGHSARYPGRGDQADLDNHANQLNPNNSNFQGRTVRKYNYQ